MESRSSVPHLNAKPQGASRWIRALPMSSTSNTPLAPPQVILVEDFLTNQPKNHLE
jgi:hypothetical protein